MAVEQAVGISIQTSIIEKIGFFLLKVILEKLVAAVDRIGYKMNCSPQK